MIANMPEARTPTIGVKVKAFGILSEFVKEKSFTLTEGSGVLDLLEAITAKSGTGLKELITNSEDSQIDSSFSAAINGDMINDFEVKLKDGDEVAFFIGVSGG